MTGDTVDVSVVIAFKDWGVKRLLTSIRSIHGAIAPLNGEVIVSDYGSEAGSVLQDVVEAAGARYVYTVTDGVWSRSRGLNAGFAISTGRVLICTDADMLFSPGSLATVARRVRSGQGEALLLQCRDLPEGYSEDELADADIDWSSLERVSRIRPRWGMGGMIAVPREAFLQVRGLDERMEIYGGEDIDFANRMRRIGLRLTWMEQRDVRMYHMWHAPTRGEVSKSPEGRAAIEANRAIVLNDASIVRNVPSWRHRPVDVEPLVSVVIATRDRAQFLAESIKSVLAQTVQDFELLVVDDGSVDETRAVVTGFDDPRIRYLYQEPRGLAAARNFGASQSRGQFTVVQDDDDLMLPWRIEVSLKAVTPDVQGVYGGWVDFTAEGSLTAHNGREFSLATLLYSNKVYLHPTLMIRTAILRSFGYNESLRSGSDFNLAVRLARAGVMLRHSGRFHILRRLHDSQVTAADSAVQGQSARLTVAMVQSHLPEEATTGLRVLASKSSFVDVVGSHDVEAEVGAFLPDRLRQRDIWITEPAGKAAGIPADRAFTCFAHTTGDEGRAVTEFLCIPGATWEHFVELALSGVPYRVVSCGGTEGGGTREGALQRWAAQNWPDLHWIDADDDAEQAPAERVHVGLRVSSRGKYVSAGLDGYKSLSDAASLLLDGEAAGRTFILSPTGVNDPSLMASFAEAVTRGH